MERRQGGVSFSALLGTALLVALGGMEEAAGQEISLVAAGDIEWSRMVRAPNIYTLANEEEVDMEIRALPATRTWVSLPLLHIPEHREKIAGLLGEELDSPTAHHLVSVRYDLEFEDPEAEARYPLERIRDLVQSADLAFANLEMPLSSRARPTGAFVGDPAFADALRWAGFDVVSLANNHAFDGETVGLLDTMDHLSDVGVRQVGAGLNLEDARRPLILERGGIRVAFFGYARSINWIGPAGFAQPDQPGILPLDPLIIREDIGRVRDEVDYVVLSFHWAIENAEDTHPDARRFAHEMIDLGADIILGHHPHVPRGVEVYNGGVIFYSLGNLIFGHNHTYWGDNYMARLSLTREGVSRVEVIPVAGAGQDLAQPYVLSGDRAQNLLENVQRLTADLDTELLIEGDVGVIRP